MTRSQQQAAVLVALVGVMAAVYSRVLHPSGSRHSAPSDVAVTPEPSTLPHEVAPEAVVRLDEDPAVKAPPRGGWRDVQREQAALLAWGRDPFSSRALNGEATGLTLTGILWDEKQPMAIIDGQTVSVGQDVQGYRVDVIKHDRVVMTDGTQPFELLVEP